MVVVAFQSGPKGWADWEHGGGGRVLRPRKALVITRCGFRHLIHR